MKSTMKKTKREKWKQSKQKENMNKKIEEGLEEEEEKG